MEEAPKPEEISQATHRVTGLGETATHIIIDVNELVEARQDPRISALLQEAEAEGRRVAAEGRQHFEW